MERFQMNKLFPTKPTLPLKKSRGKPRSTSEPPKRTSEPAKKRKAKIPASIHETIWITKMGRIFEGKCLVPWCPNLINVFDYHAGHNIPESKGGSIAPENLFPICARCNLSMGDRYTYDEWCRLGAAISQTPLPIASAVAEVPPKKSWWCC
jgi:5-methylcytosine-specific restriction endonuclease McrA